MASGQDIRAGGASVELRAIDKTKAGLDAAAARLRAWGAGIAAVGGIIAAAGAAVAGGMVAMATSIANEGKEMGELAQRTGTTVEAFTSLLAVANRLGIETPQFAAGFSIMHQNMRLAALGSHEAQVKFRALGLTVQDLAGMSSDDRFRTIADRISQIGDQGQRAAAAMSLFGESGARFLPMFNLGSEGIRQRERTAEDRGETWTAQDVANSNLFLQNINAIKRAVTTIIGEFAKALLPGLIAGTDHLKKISDHITEIGLQVVQWTRDNSGLVTVLFTIFDWCIIIGPAIVGIGGALAVLPFIVGAIASAFVGLAIVVKGLAAIAVVALAIPLAIIGNILGAIAAIGVVVGGLILFAPFLIMVGAVTAVVGAIGYLTYKLAEFVGKLVLVPGYAEEVFGAIRDAARSAGEWLARTARAGLEAWWQLMGAIVERIEDTVPQVRAHFSRVVFAIREALDAAGPRIVSWAGSAWSAVTRIASMQMGMVRGILNGVVSFAGRAWERISAGASSAWDRVASAASYVWNRITTGLAPAVSALSAGWTEMSGTAVSAWGGIVDAIQAGEIGLAVDVLWAGIKLAWEQGIGALQVAWVEFKGFVVDVVHEEWTEIQAASLRGWAAMQSGWATAVEALTVIWAGLIYEVRSSWAVIVGSILGGIRRIASGLGPLGTAAGLALDFLGVSSQEDIDRQTAADVAAARGQRDQMQGAARDIGRERREDANRAAASREADIRADAARAAEQRASERLAEAEASGNQGAIDLADIDFRNAVEAASIAAAQASARRNAGIASGATDAAFQIANRGFSSTGAFNVVDAAQQFGGGQSVEVQILEEQRNANTLARELIAEIRRLNIGTVFG